MPDKEKILSALRSIRIKEYLAVLQLIVAVVCICNSLYMRTDMKYPFDMNIFQFQYMSIVTAVHQLMFALSIWFFVSRHDWQRFYLRIFVVITSWVLCYFLFECSFKFAKRFDPELDKIDDKFERSIWDDKVFDEIALADVCGKIAVALFILSNILLTVMLIYKTVIFVREKIKGE